MTIDGYRRPLTAHAAVLSELRKRIGTGQLPPGSPIRQTQIAEELEVSKVPVREALRTLEGEGQIVHEPHRGYFVARLQLGSLLEIYRLRELLEAEALRVAVPSADDELVERLELSARELAKLSPESDMAAFVEGNRRFHFLLFRATKMPNLEYHIQLLWHSSEPYRTLYYMHDINVAQVHRDHDDIVEAVRRRDSIAAIAASKRHRDKAVEALRLLLDATDGAPLAMDN